MSSKRKIPQKITVKIKSTHIDFINDNYLLYTESAVKKGAKSWVEPYNKPVLKNHDKNTDPLGRVIKIIDPKGRTIQNGFNEMGQISEITDEFGLKTKVNYNADNQISYIEDNLGRRRYIDYKYGRAIKVTDEKNNMMRLCYNLTGEISKMKDPVGNITEFFYDSIGRPIRVKNAKGAESIIEYYPCLLYTSPSPRDS